MEAKLLRQHILAVLKQSKEPLNAYQIAIYPRGKHPCLPGKKGSVECRSWVAEISKLLPRMAIDGMIREQKIDRIRHYNL